MDARDLEIVSPCPIDLDDLGVDRSQPVLFCDHCAKEVHDLSRLTRAEAAAFVDARRGQAVCVSYLPGPGGEPRFADTPQVPAPAIVPVARLTRPRLRQAAAAAALALAACAPHGGGELLDVAVDDEVVVLRSEPVIPCASELEPGPPPPAAAEPVAAPVVDERSPRVGVAPRHPPRRGGIRPRRIEADTRIDGLLDL